MHISKYRRTGSSSQSERTPAAPADDSLAPQQGSTSQLARRARPAALVEPGQRPRVAAMPVLPPEVWRIIASYIDLQGREGLPAILARHAHYGVKRLFAAAAGLGGSDVRMIAGHPSYRTVDLSGNRIGREGAQALAASERFEVLVLRRCEMGDRAVQAFEHNAAIRRLDVSGNAIGCTGVAALARKRGLSELDASDNLIDDEGVLALAASNYLTKLYLRNNFFGDAGALALASSEMFIELDLSGNGREGNDDMEDVDEGIVNLGALMQRFGQNKTIKSLGLGNLAITDQDISELCPNTSITRLGLCGNRICDRGATALAAHSTIADLDLRDNYIEEEGVMALLANPRIKSLDLRNNFLTPTAKAALEAARPRFEKLLY